MKVCYGDLWSWLRKPKERRLSMVSGAAEGDKSRQWDRRRQLSTEALRTHVTALAAKRSERGEDLMRYLSERVLHKAREDLARLLDSKLGTGFNML